MQKAISKNFNEGFYQIFFLLNSSLPIYVVNILFYTNRGLNFKQIMMLGAISALVVIGLEVPSGILADKYGRKRMILIGLVCSIICLALMLLGRSYIHFVLSSILCGIWESFISGSDMAMIYDYFKFKEKENKFEAYFAKLNSQKFIVFSLSTLIGGSFFAYSPNLIVIISILFQAIALNSILFFKEIFEKDTRNYINIKRKFVEHFEILKRNELFNIVILFLIMTLTVSTLNQLSQQYLVEINFDIKYLGVLFFVFNIISAIGSKHYVYIKKIGVTKIIFIFSLILFSLSKIYHIGALVILLIARFFSSGIWPSLNGELNQLIESKDRASIISYKNLLISISFVIFDPINGFLIDFKNVHFVYMMFSIVLIVYFVKRLIYKD